jgi:2-polyprenyl-3-methyl-5-hydroxy-6-metoxy-1,4-benzoquinol methylase
MTAQARPAAPQRRNIRMWACHKTHEKALELIDGLPHDGRLLDMGAGEGPLSAKLRERNCRVIALDVLAENFQLTDVPLVQADLSRGLPFASGSFQGLCCLECVEHLEDQFIFIRECHRLLASGGWLLISTPNITGLASRITYLLSAMYPLARKPLNESSHNPLHDHINLIAYPKLRYILHRNGFQVRTVCTDRLRRSSLCWSFLVPFIRVATGAAMRREDDPRQRAANREIARHLLSVDLLFGRTLIVLAEKI